MVNRLRSLFKLTDTYGSMGQINFKNIKAQSAKPREALVTKLPIGIKTPITYGDMGEGIFAMHYDIGAQLHDNLKNLLLTNYGERLGMYDYGANLLPLALELGSTPNFEEEAVIRIKTAVDKYMPFIDLETFESRFDQIDNREVAKIRITVTYSIPNLNISNKKIEVVIYAGG